jgi:tetratricopeptide (TPR) repeat protein
LRHRFAHRAILFAHPQERIGILIDNLEPALDSAGKFIEAHRRYVELLRVLSDPIVQSVTLITSRERLREADITVQHYSLRSLDVQAWEHFFQSRSINTDTPALATLHDAYGGNAKAMDIISGTVLEDFSGNVEAYWQANQDDLFIERDLEDLVTKQFERLQRHEPDAYKLLCRMECYRYQDVPTVPIEGLFCLLWDVSENRHCRVVKSLQDRSLVDYEDGEFWLHPLIRAESVDRLRKEEDWETSNFQASKFWTDNIKEVEKTEDALKALEAYYQYLELSDFDQACDVLRKGRHNRWDETGGDGEPLSVSLYRLGFLNKILSILTPLLDKINPGVPLAELLNMTGEIYQEVGGVQKAIEYYKKANKVATDFNDDYIKAISLANKNSLKIELWELEEALTLFTDFSTLADSKVFKIVVLDDAEFNRWNLYAWFYLAYLNSHFGFKQKAFEFIGKVECNISKIKMTTWGKGYSSFYLGQAYKNLGEIDKAFEMHLKTLQFSNESHYTQLKAKAMYSMAELYRNQQDFSLSISENLKAIVMLKEIGACYALAEAHYQLGLTYQAMGEAGESYESFQEAIRLFSEMEAPKQVERVRKSMQNQNSEESVKFHSGMDNDPN